MIKAALAAADPHTAVSNHIQRKGSQLIIDKHKFDLANGRLFIVSVGKAAAPMAQAVLDIIGQTAVSGGGIISKHLPTDCPTFLPSYIGGHPLPNKHSIEATTAVLNSVKQATANDLVLCLISGGTSALFSQPHLPLASWQQLNQALLASGCTIQEFNTVRGQLDGVKAGGLARWVMPAKVIGLILSDVVGNDLNTIGSGPTVKRDETVKEALAILARYKVVERMDTAVYQTILTTLNNLGTTTQPPPDNILDNIIVGSVREAAQAAAQTATKLGFATRLLTTRLEGEAREVGKLAAAIAKDAPPQSATILGGETTVTLKGNGVGGRNLETALAAAVSLMNWPNRTITSFATDGDDGPTQMAGATVTGSTVLDLQTAVTHLNNNDSFTYFANKDADKSQNQPHLIQTGPTGTNVNDLVIILNYGSE